MAERAGPAEEERLPRIGCLGVGWIGRQRMARVVEDGAARVVALADLAPTAAREALNDAPGATIVAGLEQLLALELDGLMIATPSALHADQARAALEAGLAVFCQKPLGRSGAETAAVVEVARLADRLLAVDLSYRHVLAAERLRELVRAGELGRVFAAELVFHNAYGPDKEWFYDRDRSGGGCLIDLGIHLVDLALWLLDAPAARVVDRSCLCAGEPAAPGQVEDYATARLELAGGTSASIACSWRLHAGQDAEIGAALWGTRGGARLRNLNGSFFDFQLERYQGTQRELLVGPPDPWGGRAAVAWARQLARSRRYDPLIEQVTGVARLLDEIYGGASLPV